MKTATFVSGWVMKFYQYGRCFDPYTGSVRGEIHNLTTGEIHTVYQDTTGLFIVCDSCHNAVRAPNVYALLIVTSRHERHHDYGKGKGWPSNPKPDLEPMPDWEQELLTDWDRWPYVVDDYNIHEVY